MSPAHRPRPHRGAVVALLTLVLGLAGTAASSAPAQAAEGRAYVAFGDSYTSGLGIPGQRPTPSGEPPCSRSSQNYPSLVAEGLDLGEERTGDWADLSCSGSTLSGPALGSRVDLAGEVALAERIGALGPRTRLVTFAGGGNDRWDRAGLGLFTGAVLCLDSPSCPADPDPAVYVRPASVTPAGYVARATPAIERIRALAPQARIVLVTYPQLVPPTGPLCRTDLAQTTPAAPGASAYARAATDALFAAERGAAGPLGVTLADTTAATAGHDICKEPGVRWYARTGDAGADPVHPTAAAHAAVARVVLRLRPALPRPRLTGPSSARVGRSASFRATNLPRATGYRARLIRRMTVAGRTRTCTAPVGAARTASGTATFRGRIPSRLTCAGAPRAARSPATPAGRYTVRVCVERSSGTCRDAGSTATRTVRVRR
jgi:lysophospholipase L1-like esterase